MFAPDKCTLKGTVELSRIQVQTPAGLKEPQKSSNCRHQHSHKQNPYKYGEQLDMNLSRMSSKHIPVHGDPVPPPVFLTLPFWLCSQLNLTLNVWVMKLTDQQGDDEGSELRLVLLLFCLFSLWLDSPLWRLLSPGTDSSPSSSSSSSSVFHFQGCGP